MESLCVESAARKLPESRRAEQSTVKTCLQIVIRAHLNVDELDARIGDAGVR